MAKRTQAERDFVRDNAARMNDSEIAAAMTRVLGKLVTPEQVRSFRRRLGIKGRMGRPKKS